jgi:Flp pilus assembly pilin Flp
MRKIISFWRDESGLALTEYLVVVGAFVFATILGVATLSDSIGGKWTDNSTNSIWSAGASEVPTGLGAGGTSASSGGGTSASSGGGTSASSGGGTSASSDGGAASTENGNGNGNGNSQVKGPKK